MKKKGLALLVCLALIFTLVPVSAVAAQNGVFEDVQDPAEYYYNPVYWAYENTITGGVSATQFGPEEPCTRAQIVTFLWAAAGRPEDSPKLGFISYNPFSDVSSDDWFYKAVMWAVSNGITAGTSATTFSPEEPCTRAQCVTFLWRAQGSPSVSGEIPFEDVSKDSYYYDAVAWAVANGVTGGTSATTFSPDEVCTRAQIVTFLYKAMNGSYSADTTGMKVGVGKATITGPITDISTGYNSVGDLMEGLLMNLYARAFVVENGGSTMAYVAAEVVHMTESIKPGVIQELQKRGLTQYTESNVMIAATHCHSSTSNVSWYALYDLVNGVPGYDDESYEIIVQGIANAIEKADKDLAPGSISLAYDEANVDSYNRSILAYGENMNVDLSQFSSLYEAACACTNKEMSVISFSHDGEGKIGLISFFASHGTSNSIENTLVAADHKGYAAYYVEQQMGGDFVAAFPQNESGDASPNEPQKDNVKAAFQRPNEVDTSLDAIENEIVDGQQEADETLRIMQGKNGATVIDLSDVTAYNYTTVDFKDVSVSKEYIGNYYMPYDNIENAKTSVPCIGAGIIAGDEEGAPVDNAEEGTVKHTFSVNSETGEVTRTKVDFSAIDLSGLEKLFDPLWPYAMKILESDEYDDAQMEKVVCLATSDRSFIGDLKETIEPFQVFRIGELAIASVPFELTTEAARRINETLSATLAQAGVKKVIFSTLTNSYSQYITTREEYAAQHYEGSTSLYGPWSDAAAKQELDLLCQDLVNGKMSDAGPGMVQSPSNVTSNLVYTYAAGTTPLADTENCGALVSDVAKSTYSNGETVSATFQAANPRHITILRLEGNDELAPEDYTYLEVQQQVNGEWVTVRTDEDPYTYIRIPGFTDNVNQTATVNWLIKQVGGGQVPSGTYRLVYNGVKKNVTGSYEAFSAYSSPFNVA